METGVDNEDGLFNSCIKIQQQQNMRKRRYSETAGNGDDAATTVQKSGIDYAQDVSVVDLECGAPATKYRELDSASFQLDELCDEMLFEIFKHLDSWTLLALMNCCERFNAFVLDNRFWNDVDLSQEPLPLGILESVLERTHSNSRTVKLRGPPPAQHIDGEIQQFSKTLVLTFSTRCTELRTLELQGVTIDFRFLRFYDFPRTIKRLIFNDCNVRIPEPEVKSIFSGLDTHLLELEELGIEYSDWFEPHYIMLFSKAPALRWLSLKGCVHLAEFVPYGSMAARFGFKKLEYLDMRFTPITDSDLQCFNAVLTLKEILLDCPENLRNLRKEPLINLLENEPSTSSATRRFSLLATNGALSIRTAADSTSSASTLASTSASTASLSASTSSAASTAVSTAASTATSIAAPSAAPTAAPTAEPTAAPTAASTAASTEALTLAISSPPQSSISVSASTSATANIFLQKARQSVENNQDTSSSSSSSPSSSSSSSPSNSPSNSAPSSPSAPLLAVANGNLPARSRFLPRPDQIIYLDVNNRRRPIIMNGPPRRPPNNHADQLNQVLMNPTFWDMIYPLGRRGQNAAASSTYGRNSILAATALRRNRDPISDRGVCCFGRPPNPVDDAIIWIRVGYRPSENRFERLTVRNYKQVTDTSLMHLVQCSPHLVFLDLSGTGVTKSGIQKFKNLKPECQIVANHLASLEDVLSEDEGCF